MNTYAPIMQYASWADFVAASRAETDMKSGRASKSEDANWKGCTLAKAHEYADLGWLEGAERARRVSESISDTLGQQIERHVVNYDVEGHSIDVARFVQNEPECWMKFETELIEMPSPQFIRIVVNGTASAGVSARVIEARGAAICALVELLEYTGHRTELVLAQAIGRGASPLQIFVTLKRFDETLDMPKVVYAFAHPSVLRVHVFALMETFNASVRANLDVGGGYGRVGEVERSERGDLYMGGMEYGQSDWATVESATAWVKTQLENFGVELHQSASA